jgi:LmbE family N-acetylglucosaminyl deacetylase
LNILAIGAHPDDIELGCFGTLANHSKRGDSVFVAVLTNGELEGEPNIRKEETAKACKLINAKLFYGNFPDGSVEDSSKLVSFLDEIVEKNEISVMYTHSLHDRHQDHRNAANACISAGRYVKELYSYESPSVIYPYNPHVFIDVTDTFPIKMEAIKTHKTQKKKNYMRADAVEGLAKFRSLQCGLQNKLCEAFEVNKIVKDITNQF